MQSQKCNFIGLKQYLCRERSATHRRWISIAMRLRFSIGKGRGDESFEKFQKMRRVPKITSRPRGRARTQERYIRTPRVYTGENSFSLSRFLERTRAWCTVFPTAAEIGMFSKGIFRIVAPVRGSAERVFGKYASGNCGLWGIYVSTGWQSRREDF